MMSVSVKSVRHRNAMSLCLTFSFIVAWITPVATFPSHRRVLMSHRLAAVGVLRFQLFCNRVVKVNGTGARRITRMYHGRITRSIGSDVRATTRFNDLRTSATDYLGEAG